MANLINYLVMAGVFFLMLGVGLQTPFAQVVDVLKNFGVLIKGVLANFLVVPILIYLGIAWLPIQADIKIGIMLMAAAPIAPMAVPFATAAKGDLPYSVGLVAIVSLLCVLLTPLILILAAPKSQGGIELNVIEIVKILVTAQLIPICAGMLTRKYRPGWLDILLKVVPRIGQLCLLVGVGLLLASQFKQIVSIGAIAHLVILASVVLSLLVGYCALIGETPERRHALAVLTAVRNIPLAFLIAGSNFPDSAVAPVALVFSVFSMILAILYGKLVARESPA